LLAASRTRAVSVTFPVALELNCGLLTKRSIWLALAIKVTVVLALKPLVDAVTVALPELIGAMRFTVAMPLASVMAVAVVADAAKLPAVVLKVTEILESGPEVPCTVARIATAFTPLAIIGPVAPFTTVIDVTEDETAPPDGPPDAPPDGTVPL